MPGVDRSIKGLFICTVNVTIYVSSTFDLFNVMCKQRDRDVLNPFLKGTKNCDIDDTCKRSLSDRIIEVLYPMSHSQGWLRGIVSGVGPVGGAGNPGRRSVWLPHHRGRLRRLLRHPPQISRSRESHHTHAGKGAFTRSESEYFLNLCRF